MRAWLFLLLLTACGDSAPGGIAADGGDKGQSRPCDRDEACADPTDCTADRCVDGWCTTEPADCSAASDGCNLGVCVEGKGCIGDPVDDGTACDDGLFCTQDDACDRGICQGAPTSCAAFDGECAVGSCDEAADSCVGEPLGDGLVCDDGLACTVRETCQGTTCAGVPFDCAALDDTCTVGRCDEALASCVADAIGPFPGLEGPLGDPSCTNGLDDDCNGLFDDDDPVCNCPDCSDGDVCTADGCDPVTRNCVWTTRTIDEGSLVRSSSLTTPQTVCLVAGSNARTVVWVDLRDTDGAAISGAVVNIGGVAAGESTAQPRIYWREIQASAAQGDTVLTVGVDWCSQSVVLDDTVTVSQVAGNSTSGGTGGCSPADGNLRVRVVAAETGAPIAGASVLVGLAEGMTLEHAPEAWFGGAAIAASNLATTDGTGTVQLYDYGTTLADTLTVTAGAPGRAYFTVVDGAASDLVLPLPLIAQSPVPSTRYTDGTGTGSLTGCEELDFALVIPQQRLEALAIYDRNSWLEKNRCHDTGNIVFGTMVLPENYWMPAQQIGPFCLLGSMNEARWSVTLPDTAATGITQDVSLDLGSVSLDLAMGGSTLIELVTVTDYHHIGFLLDEAVPTPPTSGRSIDANEDYNTYNVTFAGKPLETDVVGIGAADYDGTNGSGPLLFMGEAVHEWDGGGNSVAIPNSDLDAPGAPPGVRRLAIVAALYLDKGAHPGVPANRIDGVSSVLVRDDGAGGPPFGPPGGNGSVTDFLDISGTRFALPGDFSWDDAAAPANTPLYSVHELGVRTRRHLPVLSCTGENEIRDALDVQWIVVKPYDPSCAGQECFTLPLLPPSFPRAASGVQQKSGFLARVGAGGTCSGACPVAGETCVDPDGGGAAATMCMGGSGSDADPFFTQDYLWQIHLYDLELAPSFDFNDFEFSQRRAWQTHESFNKQSFD